MLFFQPSYQSFPCLSSNANMKRHLSDEAEWCSAVTSTFLNGNLSAGSCRVLVEKASKAGAKGAEKFSKAGKSGSNRNVHRDFLRMARKSSLWPKLYYATIPVYDPKKEIVEFRSHPFLLPHEWLATALVHGSLNHFTASSQHAAILNHIQKVAHGLGSPASEFIALGLHCDGVPYGSQIFYSDSLELFTINLPTGPEGNGGMRIPFTSVQKQHLVKHQTYNAVLEVLAWSLKQLAFGCFPTSRHDGSDWGPADAGRAKLAKALQPAKALLTEIRADWVALKQIFQFPQQNENSGICWMCTATPADIRNPSMDASWRSTRQTAMSFHKGLKDAGKVCPLWSAPGVCKDIVIVDWLHCADLGVAADVLGNVLLELLDQLHGGDKQQKVSSLWSEIKTEYNAQGVNVSCRFPYLKLQSFWKGAKKSPKLKGKAAHIRGLVPVLDSIVQKRLLSDDVHVRTVKSCMHELAVCYKCLVTFDATVLDVAARRMALLYVALEKEAEKSNAKRWKVKPKLHLFLELASFLCLQKQFGNPKNFWTYSDESYGGKARHAATKRGGKNSSSSSAYKLLQSWCAKTNLLDLVA